MSCGKKPSVLVFASGTKTGGGSGFQKMIEAKQLNPPVLDTWIPAVISNHCSGGVARRAEKLGIEFLCWEGPFKAKGYQNFVKYFNADFVMLSGWLKLVAGLDPARTINIHPGPLPNFGGPKFYGHYVHEAVLVAYHRGEITHSAVTMHFVNEEFDRGPVFFALPVPIEAGDTPETLAARVNQEEHRWQSKVLNMVVHEQVRLVDGKVIYESEELHRLLMSAAA